MGIAGAPVRNPAISASAMSRVNLLPPSKATSPMMPYATISDKDYASHRAGGSDFPMKFRMELLGFGDQR